MTRSALLEPADVDVLFEVPSGLVRVCDRGLTDLSPWQVMERDLAKERLTSLRTRYSTKYIPFARRLDNDDLACLDPAKPGRVAVIHDYADDGSESRREFASFWDWFRYAVEDMIAFEP